jgi:hypothetical protein
MLRLLLAIALLTPSPALAETITGVVVRDGAYYVLTVVPKLETGKTLTA